MFGECDGPGMQLQPSGSLSKGNGSLLCTERWKLSKWVEWLTSSDRELDYNKWRLTWPETGKHPLKPRSAFHLGETGREKGQERAVCPTCPALLSSGFLFYLPILLTWDLCAWRPGSCEYNRAALPSITPACCPQRVFFCITVHGRLLLTLQPSLQLSKAAECEPHSHRQAPSPLETFSS